MRVTVLLIMAMVGTLLVAGTAHGAKPPIPCSKGVFTGSSGPDDICGTRKDDALYGRGDFDVVIADIGDDAIYGENGPDGLYDRAGNDVISAGAGNDRVNYGKNKVRAPANPPGLPDDDLVFGGDGNDLISSLSGADAVYGGGGQDNIHAVDARPDYVDCGTGYDTVFFNAGRDLVVGCEVWFVYGPFDAANVSGAPRIRYR